VSHANGNSELPSSSPNRNAGIPPPAHGATNGNRVPFYSDDAGWTRVTRQKTCEPAVAPGDDILAEMPPLSTTDAPSPSPAALAVQMNAQPATAAARVAAASTQRADYDSEHPALQLPPPPRTAAARVATALTQQAEHDSYHPALPLPPSHVTAVLPPCEHRVKGFCDVCNAACQHGVAKWSCHMCANARIEKRAQAVLRNSSLVQGDLPIVFENETAVQTRGRQTYSAIRGSRVARASVAKQERK
jgi:hypothetical protein